MRWKRWWNKKFFSFWGYNIRYKHSRPALSYRVCYLPELSEWIFPENTEVEALLERPSEHPLEDRGSARRWLSQDRVPTLKPVSIKQIHEHLKPCTDCSGLWSFPPHASPSEFIQFIAQIPKRYLRSYTLLSILDHIPPTSWRKWY